MTLLADRIEMTTSIDLQHAVLGGQGPTEEVELTFVVAYVTADGERFAPVMFEGESLRQIDEDIAAYVAENPSLSIEIGDDAPLGALPRAFQAIYLTT